MDNHINFNFGDNLETKIVSIKEPLKGCNLFFEPFRIDFPMERLDRKNFDYIVTFQKLSGDIGFVSYRKGMIPLYKNHEEFFPEVQYSYDNGALNGIIVDMGRDFNSDVIRRVVLGFKDKYRRELNLFEQYLSKEDLKPSEKKYFI